MEKKLFLSLMVQKHGGARGIGLETPELLWSMFRLSSICVANFITFQYMVVWAAIDSVAKQEEKH